MCISYRVGGAIDLSGPAIDTRRRLSFSLGGDSKLVFGRPLRRRGARLGLAIALMVILPGVVVGTKFISGTSTSLLNGSGVASSALECGFDLGNTHSVDSGPLTISGSTEIGATGLYSAIAVTVNEYEVGSSGFEYLDGEVDIACISVGQSGSLGMYMTASTALTGATWGYAAVEAGIASPFASATIPSITYCAPGGDAPTNAFPEAYGGACAGSVQTACDALSPAVFLPNDKDATFYVYNLESPGTAITGCGTTGGATVGTANTIVSALTVTATLTYYGIVSFAIGGASSSVNAASFTMTLVGTSA